MDGSLDDTIARLDEVVAEAVATESRLAVFPAMYRSVTTAVRDAVRAGGFFDDDARLEELSVVFAGYYLDAWDQRRSGDEPAAPWKLAFDAAESPHPRMVLQHLLLGMNAHINRDLGLATSDVAGERLAAAYGDFIRVNEILFDILDRLQAGLGQVSPRMSWLDRLGGPWDESVMRIGIRTARDLAWHFAEHLVDHGSPSETIREREADAVWLGRLIARRWSPVHVVGVMIARAETAPMREVVEALTIGDVDLGVIERRAADEHRRRPAADGSLRSAAVPLRRIAPTGARRRLR
jgi:hypothetical protein